MNQQFIIWFAIVLPVAAMVVWFCKTVPQGSISFTFGTSGLHFEVKKGS